jgi:hypothetical protein
MKVYLRSLSNEKKEKITGIVSKEFLIIVKWSGFSGGINKVKSTL